MPDRRLLAVLIAVIASLLVAGVVGAAVVEDDDDVAAPATTTTTSTGAPPSSTVVAPATTIPDAQAARFEAVVRELQAFVSRVRGLPYKEPVKVELLDEAAFKQRLLGEARDDEQIERIRTAQRVLEALKVIDKGTDLEKTIDALLGQAVAGLYDPEKGELVVRGGEPTPFARRVLAHELTHALEDQHFELHRPDLDDREDESAYAFSVLHEGSAVRVERAYYASLSRSERQAADAEELRQARGIGSGIPTILVQGLQFPYIYGPRLVAALLDAGGQARLDAAFKDPLVTTEQALHPALFLNGEGPKAVAEPAADAKVIDRGVLGELDLRLVLGDSIDAGQAQRAAAGWGGDRYVAWARGGSTCFRVALVMDSARDVEELESALREWAGDHGDATVTGGGEAPLVLTACG